jgi:hypothetical protein
MFSQDDPDVEKESGVEQSWHIRALPAAGSRNYVAPLNDFRNCHIFAMLTECFDCLAGAGGARVFTPRDKK